MLPALSGASDPAVTVLLFVLLVLIRVGGEGVPLVLGDSETCLRSTLTEVRGRKTSSLLFFSSEFRRLIRDSCCEETITFCYSVLMVN
jgi:hypothetical protein